MNNYGIPPDPNGGHEHGVDIEIQKYQVEGKTKISLDNRTFKSIKAALSHKSYYHKEIEHSGAVGTEYGVLTTNGKITTNHQSWGFFDEGTIGLWGETKNYAVNGTQTPDSDAHSLAGFVVEEKDIEALHLEAVIRFELTQSIPEEEYSASIGEIRERTFSGLTTSASVIYDLGRGFFSEATFMHSFRAPSQEKLYSEGPHLASYSYEVGNPDLNPE